MQPTVWASGSLSIVLLELELGEPSAEYVDAQAACYALSYKVLFLCPKSLVSSASIQEIVVNSVGSL